jgi:type IV pilus assembly protein PilP
MVKLLKLLLPILILLMTACQQEKDDLTLYVAKIKARPPSPIAPIPVLKPYEKFEYAASDLHNPFLPVVVDLPDAVVEEKVLVDNGIRPDTNRLKEALEEYSLGELSLVGTLEQEAMWALIRSPEGVIHRVQVGNYIGKNYGQILSISEAEVALQETVPDGNGGYIHRNNTLSVRE